MTEKIGTGLLIYRYQDDGLEVFLVPSQASSETWGVPNEVTEDSESAIAHAQRTLDEVIGEEEHIVLDPVNCDTRKMRLLTKAFELVDVTKLPSTSKRRRFFEANKGAFIAMKEAFKKVAPAEYQMLKELHEVLSVRNVVKYM